MSTISSLVDKPDDAEDPYWVVAIELAGAGLVTIPRAAAPPGVDVAG